jgi:hypothetical protein
MLLKSFILDNESIYTKTHHSLLQLKISAKIKQESNGSLYATLKSDFFYFFNAVLQYDLEARIKLYIAYI